MPQSHITKALLRALRDTPGYPHLTILDLSCGEAEILRALHNDGCDVRGTWYRVDDYILPENLGDLSDLKILRDVDLHQRLPFDDASADVVLLSEVLEHLRVHAPVISEAGRILKPGGHLIFSTPNIQRLHSRWQFFLTGTHKLIRRRVGWDVPAENLYAYHITPVDFPFMHTLLSHAKLRVEQLRFTKFKARHGFWFLLYPLFYLATRLTIGPRSKQSALCQAGERDLARWMVHPAMLGSEQLLVISRRVDEPFDAPTR